MWAHEKPLAEREAQDEGSNRIKPNIEQKHCLIFDTFSLLLLFVSHKFHCHYYETEGIAYY